MLDGDHRQEFANGFGSGDAGIFKALFDTTFANQVGELLAGKALPKPEEKPSDALRLLTVLQRDGRLIDFLMEQVDGYPDEQLGAAVRQIQKDCRSALGKYVTLAPIMKEEEGQKVTIQPGFDAKRVRLTAMCPAKVHIRVNSRIAVGRRRSFDSVS